MLKTRFQYAPYIKKIRQNIFDTIFLFLGTKTEKLAFNFVMLKHLINMKYKYNFNILGLQNAKRWAQICCLLLLMYGLQ